MILPYLRFVKFIFLSFWFVSKPLWRKFKLYIIINIVFSYKVSFIPTKNGSTEALTPIDPFPLLIFSS